MRISTPLLLAGWVSLAAAHFTLSYPPTRGFDEDKETDFCGGATVNTNRTEFPMSNAFVSLTSSHAQGDISVHISLDQNPTTFDDFNKTSNGTMLPFVINFTHMNAAGDACLPANINQLNIPGATNGANATLLVQVVGPDGTLFQCSDIVLSTDAEVPSGTKCDNTTGAFPTSSSSDGSNGGNSSADNASDNSGSFKLIASTLLAAGASALAVLSLAIV